MVKGMKLSRRVALAVTTLGVVIAPLVATGAQQKKGEGRHPRLVRAIEALEEARDYLKKAPNNFGGHKKKAVQSITTAIDDVKLALEHAEEK